MKPRRSPPQHSFYLLALSMLVTPFTEAADNRKPIANAGFDVTVGLSKSVTLDGQRSFDPDGTLEKYEWSQITGPKVTLQQTLTASPTFKSPSTLNNQESVTLVFKLTVTDNQNELANDVVAVTVAKFTGKLNDTGIITCSDGTTNNLTCPVAGFPNQDAETGRDAVANNNVDGHAGFSFIKISSIGKALPASAKKWNCVQDRVTGLMWEVKTNDGRLHDKDWTYSWYEPDNSKNGGSEGGQNDGKCGRTSQCDTDAYVKAVNAVGWCGAKDWRMPTRKELSSIISYNRIIPAIDAAYFPNTVAKGFWSSSPYAIFHSYAWYVNFYFPIGFQDVDVKYYGKYQVRLVRSGQ
jgi:hypothetical protein